MSAKWINPTTRQEVETALDAGKLYAEWVVGKWWQVRRNGQTQTWKRDPGRFRIPFKVGFKGCGAIDQNTLASYNKGLRIAASRKDAESPLPAQTNVGG